MAKRPGARKAGMERLMFLADFTIALTSIYGAKKLDHPSPLVLKFENPWAQQPDTFIWIAGSGVVRIARGPSGIGMTLSDGTIQRAIDGKLAMPTGTRVDPETPVGSRYVA